MKTDGRMVCDLRDDGVEAQSLENDERRHSHHFDAHALAVRWSEHERHTLACECSKQV
jgi:hypothetical protein